MRLELHRESHPGLLPDAGHGWSDGPTGFPPPEAGWHGVDQRFEDAPPPQWMQPADADPRPVTGDAELPAYHAALADLIGRRNGSPSSRSDHPDVGAAPQHPTSEPAVTGAVVDEDAEPTRPLPVILPGATKLPRPAPVEAPRGFFEAARPARSASVTGSVDPPPSGAQLDGPSSARPMPSDSPADHLSERVTPEAANAKLEQIKDLYLTAEAIGEDALDKHFEQVSQRQRELIKEFFDRSRPGTGSG